MDSSIPATTPVPPSGAARSGGDTHRGAHGGRATSLGNRSRRARARRRGRGYTDALAPAAVRPGQADVSGALRPAMTRPQFRELITRLRVFARDFFQDPSRAGAIPPPNPSPAHRRTPRIVGYPGSDPSGTRWDAGRDSPRGRTAIRSCGRDISPRVEGAPARGRIRVRPSLWRPPPRRPDPGAWRRHGHPARVTPGNGFPRHGQEDLSPLDLIPGQ
jgi:hypothetical protein